MGFQLNTDFSGIAPDEGGGRSYFPVSDSKGWLVNITDSKGVETNKKDGTRLDLVLTGLEGPVQGKFMDFSINITNPSQKAVEIGFGQMSAIAHVTGHIRVGNSAEWHGKPFRVVVISDASEQYPHATKIAKILDLNGNSAKNAGQGVVGAATQNNAGNFNAQNFSVQNGGVGSQGAQNGGGNSNAGWNGGISGGTNGGDPIGGQQPPVNQTQQFQANGNGAQFQPQGQQGQQFQPQQQGTGNGNQLQQQGQTGGFQQNNGSSGPGWNQ